MTKYVVGFNKLSYPAALLCDSDCTEINNQKLRFKNVGIEVIDCEGNSSIEQQVFKDIPWGVVKELIQIAIKKVVEDNGMSSEDAKKMIFDSTNTHLQNTMTQVEN